MASIQNTPKGDATVERRTILANRAAQMWKEQLIHQCKDLLDIETLNRFESALARQIEFELKDKDSVSLENSNGETEGPLFWAALDSGVKLWMLPTDYGMTVSLTNGIKDFYF